MDPTSDGPVMPTSHRAAFWIEHAVTRGQYVDPTPKVRAVNGERRNEALATGDLFDDAEPWVRPEWQERSSCTGGDLVPVFFSTRGQMAAIKEAKAICAGCVVREECLEYALVHGIKFGTWGGTSERERRSMRRARALEQGAA
jgi:WhiB family redox-sensing transcriptional regulator